MGLIFNSGFDLPLRGEAIRIFVDEVEHRMNDARVPS